jgi:hypothetical protein
VDCRTARALIGQTDDLTPAQKDDLVAHLTRCAACHDDAADPMGRLLAQTMAELALPPPDFTHRLLVRLPPASPLELAQQAARRRRRWFITAGIAGVGLLIGVVALGRSLQLRWGGTSLGLAAQAIQEISAAAVWPLLLMIIGGAILASLLVNLLRRPTTQFALSIAAFTCLLVIVTGVVTLLVDRANASAVKPSQPAAVATILYPITLVRDTGGNVTSLAGSIKVAGDVGGNVVSLLGDVTLGEEARVAGSVLVGSGRLTGQETQVAGRIHHGANDFALASGVPGTDANDLSPRAVRLLTGLLGALITFTLAGLMILVWPHRVTNASAVLHTQPWVAFGLGVVFTLLLVLLALPVLALLAFTVAGLLLVPPLLLALHLPYVLGIAGLGQTLGRRLTGTTAFSSALWSVAAQMMLVLGLSLWVPLAGLIVFYLLAGLGLGAYVLSRQVLA